MSNEDLSMFMIKFTRKKYKNTKMKSIHGVRREIWKNKELSIDFCDFF